MVHINTVRRKVILTIAALLVSILSITAVVVAQTSANFSMAWSTLAGGGGERQSANFVIQDTVGQMTAGVANSANSRIVGGFIQDQVAANADEFEADNSCGAASVIDTVGTKQAHNFHVVGDQDWLRFTAQANKTYVIEVRNVGADADGVILLQDACDQPPAGQGTNSFGSTVTLEWDSTKNGDYFVKLQQFDPSFFGANANYEVSIKVDNVPPSAPENPRCIAINATTLGMQWKKSPERDVRKYRISFTGAVSGNEDVPGASTTFYELGGLTPNQTYNLRVRSLDYSGNESQPSGEVNCTAQDPVDTTQPVLALANPTGNTTVYSTTANILTFSGNASDAGNNLSRVQLKNSTANVEKWDYSLTGQNDEFRVADVALNIGDNNVQLTVHDAAGNTSQKQVTVRRLGQVAGGVIIIAGHNETFGLQTNIYNAANRAYRIFRSAGFTDEDIYYIAPVAQDVDGTGGNQVDATSSPAAIENAIKNWAKEGDRVGSDKPLFIYMVDHGFAEKFCASGCEGAGAFTPKQMDEWIRQLETDTGVDQVNIVIEACQSGSFLDRVNDPASSLSKAGRVVITSTGRDNNAYASAEGAYFSDAFFSCVADSNNLKVCYDEGVQAVEGTGVDQTPWLDDNGDGISNEGDGATAQQRVVTRFFSSVRPKFGIVNVTKEGVNGTLTANVEDGAEEVALVWAAIFPPSFVEPTDVTLNLNIPTVRLEADPDQEGLYSFTYANGFTEEGDYRIIFYAQDRLGIHAVPKREGERELMYVPSLHKE